MTATTTAATTRTNTRPRLFTPGPVEIPVRVLQAMSVPQPHHRTEGFRKIFQEVTAQLARLHGTQGEVFILAASGHELEERAGASVLQRPADTVRQRDPHVLHHPLIFVVEDLAVAA